MRLAVGIMIVVLALCAIVAAHQHKPFLTPAIDPGPGVLPASASRETVICAPVLGPWIERKKIVRA